MRNLFRKTTAWILVFGMILSVWTAAAPVSISAASGEWEQGEEWYLQQFGGDTDLELSDTFLSPAKEGGGFTLEYGRMTEAEGYGSVIVYNHEAEVLRNSIWEFKMKVSGIDTASNRYQIGIFPRFINGKNCDGIAIDTSSSIQHSYQVNGSEGWPSISNISGISFAVNREYAVKMVTLDERMTMYVDGVKAAETDTRTEIEEGRYAIRIWGLGDGSSSYTKKFELYDNQVKELKNSSVDLTEKTIPADRWGSDDIEIPITLDQEDIVASIANDGTELTEGEDYAVYADRIVLKKEYVDQQESGFTLQIVFQGGMSGKFQIKKYNPDVSAEEYIWTPEQGETDWMKLSGTGSYSMQEEGLHLKGENKLLAVKAMSMESGEIEITFEQKNDNGRMGFLFRADKDSGSWQGILHDDDYAYSTWYYKNSTGTRNGFHGDGSFLFSREGLALTTLKLRYWGENNVAMWMDNYMMYEGTVSGISAGEGLIGVSTESVSDIVLKKVVVRSLPETYLPEQTKDSEVIGKAGLEVSLASDFPRVISYTLNGKKLYGSEFRHNFVTLNTVDYPASAVIAEQEADRIVYHVTVESAGAAFDVAYTAEDKHVLDMRIQNIEEGNLQIRSIGFPHQPMLSANSMQDNARLDATVPTDGRSEYNINGLEEHHYHIKDGKISYERDTLATLPFITTDELSASMDNNVLLNLKEFRYRAYQKEDGSITAGYENNDFMYRGIDGEKMFPDTDLYCRVVLTEDTNGDGSLDWQDGANALKTINRDKIWGGDKVADSFIHVGYNFASQVQQPFLKVADNMKRLSNYIDGFDQILVLKGYANEGHDSAHADYDDINQRAGGAEDMQKCADIIEDINSVIGIHINHSEAYPEAKMFNEQVISTYDGWSWLDQSKHIRRDVDIMTGGMDNRLNSMFQKVPGIGFVYVDTYGDDRWAEARLAHNLVEKHKAILGTENKTDFDRFAAWVHWPGIGDSMHRFVYHQQKDVYSQSSIFRGGYTRSASFMSWQHNNNIHTMVEQFFAEQLPQKYLMNHDVRKWSAEEAIFEGNVRSTRENKIYKDGNLIADGRLVFIPWFDEDSETKNPDEAAKIYHWNPNGGDSTWVLPESWSSQTSVKLYETTQNGKKLVRQLQVKDGSITIHAEAKTPYVIYKGSEEQAFDMTKWSEGSPIEDTSFNSRDFSIWKAESSAGTTEHIKISDDSRGIALLTIEGEEDGCVSQTMKDLAPGQKYRVSVWAGAENGKTARLTVTTPDGKEVQNYTENTPMTNHNLDTYAQDKKVQRVWVDFVQPDHETTAVLKLSADASSGNGRATFMETRIVKTDAPDLPGNYAAWEDFEHVDQAFGIFAPESREEYSHLSETHLPYTDDTISGNWSMQKGTTMRTQPSTARILPNTEYTLEFAAIGSGKVYVESESDGSRIMEEPFTDGVNTYQFITDQKKDYIVRIANGEIIDDFKLYYIDDPTPPSIPEHIEAEMTENACVRVSWNPSTDEDSGVSAYRVYRNGQLAATVTEPVYLDMDVTEYTTYVYEISAVNAGHTESEKSQPVKGYYGTEISPLVLESAEIKTKDTIAVTFNRNVDQESAKQSDHYRISDGAKVVSAALDKNGKTVLLSVENMAVEKPMILSVTGVKDMTSSQNICNGNILVSLLARYYKFEEDSAEKAVDFMGIEDGKKISVTMEEDGYSGKAAGFLATSGVQLSCDALYQAKEWTLTTWIKWNGKSGESQTIMGNGISGVSNAAGMWFHIRQDEKLWASPWANGSGKDMCSTASIPVGTWTHVAIQYTADEEFVMYINGQEAGRIYYPGYPTDIENRINIGYNVNGSGSMIHKFNGFMDELKIYRTALDAEQIIAEAQREMAPYVIGDWFVADKNADRDLYVMTDTNGYILSEAKVDGNVLAESGYTMDSNTFVLKKESIESMQRGTHSAELTFIKEGDVKKAEFTLEISENAKAVNKSSLYRLISMAGDLNGEEFSIKSWAALQTALIEAKTVLDNRTATQQQADDAAAVLDDAIRHLLRADKEELSRMIAEAEEYTAEFYSSESYQALERALITAKAVLEKVDADKDAVAAQIQNLQKAMDGLEDLRSDKQVLKALYDAVIELDLNVYTEQSIKILKAAIEKTEQILNKENALKAETDLAEKELFDALTGLERKQEEPVEKADPSMLTMVYNIYKDWNTAGYTEESVKGLDFALKNAASVLSNDQAGQDIINKALEELVYAVSNLVYQKETPSNKVDYTVLESFYQAYKDMDMTLYSQESAQKLQDAIQSAAKLLKESNASQSEVDQAAAELARAAAGLKIEKKDISDADEPSVKMGGSYKAGKLYYKITSLKFGAKTVEVLKPVKKTKVKISIPSTVNIKGYTFRVTKIHAKAFQNNRNLQNVTIGKNITSIGKLSFSGCKKLKKIVIQSAVLKKIGTNAFRNISDKAKIRVPGKKYTSYKRLLKNAKLSGKVKIEKATK